MDSPPQIFERALESGVFPGCSAHFSRDGETVFAETFGVLGYETPLRRAVTPETLYDLASLTKIYTLAAFLLACSEAQLAPENTPACAFLPGLDARITLEHLLAHSSGLGLHLQTLEAHPTDQWLDEIIGSSLRAAPGREVFYNCSNFFLLARALEKITGQTLDEFLAARILGPLRLENTTFAPSAPIWVAPTEKRHEGGYHHGVVHDEAARVWRRETGTCAGNAGLFATAADVAKFASIWLLDGKNSPIAAAWRARSMLPVLPEKSGFRSWGWQRDAAFYMGELPASRQREFLIGHLGFTGTSLVLNPRGGEIAVVLSNRVHPTSHTPDRLPFVKMAHEWLWRV